MSDQKIIYGDNPRVAVYSRPRGNYTASIGETTCEEKQERCLKVGRIHILNHGLRMFTEEKLDLKRWDFYSFAFEGYHIVLTIELHDIPAERLLILKRPGIGKNVQQSLADSHELRG